MASHVPPAIPEPMNSTPHHSKVKISTTLSDSIFVAGDYVSGKLEMECRADKGLGIGIMMVELFAIQELSSRDHSATSTFLHSRRLFQGPGLPPSNAVQAHPQPGDPVLPEHHYQARRGRTTFLFRIPIPSSSPSTITFGTGLARVRYELRASVGVYWKDDKRFVLDKKSVDVVASYPYDEVYLSSGIPKEPEGIVVGENGKLWMQGRVVGSVIVAGESACLELQVKNHSAKKNTGLTLSLTRTLYLPISGTGTNRSPPVHLSDTLTTIPFRGSEYIIPPGAEGIANLVFDVPKHARGVRGGILDGEEAEGSGLGPRHSESLFEIKCKIEVKLSMGMGSKDIILEIPVEIVHKKALPAPEPFHPRLTYIQPYTDLQEPLHYPVDYTQYHSQPPPAIPTNPIPMPYHDHVQNQVWIPPGLPPLSLSPAPVPQAQAQIPISYTPVGYPNQRPDFLALQNDHPPQSMPYGATEQSPFYHGMQQYPEEHENQWLLFPQNTGAYIQRPSSAGAIPSVSELVPPMVDIPGLPLVASLNTLTSQSLLPLPEVHLTPTSIADNLAGSPEGVSDYEQREVGKGERAARVTRHMRVLSRNRSVSPLSHRYPILGPGPAQFPPISLSPTATNNRQPRILPNPPLLLPSTAQELSMSPPPSNAQLDQYPQNVLHSPRPQLTPKHSFTRDPVLGTMTIAKSERVENLEKMADEVGRQKRDLSNDLPESLGEDFASGGLGDKASADVNKNKTLPGPPVPSTKAAFSPLPSRARADRYFSGMQETAPLPSDQTPPTPNLVAVLPKSRQRFGKSTAAKARDELRTENGLDALERRLLAEVGTRKFDKKEIRPDLNSVVSLLDTSNPNPSLSDANVDNSLENVVQPSATGTSIGSIPIPTSTTSCKSPEPLHDSAISSLTLAGGLGVEESDGELDAENDGKTHKAGKSANGGSGSDDEREKEREEMYLNSALHQHMREREREREKDRGERSMQASTPTSILGAEWEKTRMSKSKKSDEDDKFEKKDSSKSKGSLKTNGKLKKEKSIAAKGRVAAWLGGIDPGVPPLEQIIPPSPSVVKGPPSPFDVDMDVGGSGSDEEQTREVRDTNEHDLRNVPAAEVAEPQINNLSASPNPRSSGFVSIATLKKAPINMQPLVSPNATIAKEAKLVQDIWSNDTDKTPVIQSRNVQLPFFLRGIGVTPPTGQPITIRTNRKVSPPSAKPTAAHVVANSVKTQKPLSYSAAAAAPAARNVWRLPEVPKAKSPPVTPRIGTVSNSVPVSVSVDTGRFSPAKRQTQQQVQSPQRTQKGEKQRLEVNRNQVVFPPSKAPVNPDVKYDVRSARGGRGGKVASVASLWSSGAVQNANLNTNNNAKNQVVREPTKGAAKSTDNLNEKPYSSGIIITPHQNNIPLASSVARPLPVEKRLFSAAVKSSNPATPKAVPAMANTAVVNPTTGADGKHGKPLPSFPGNKRAVQTAFTPSGQPPGISKNAIGRDDIGVHVNRSGDSQVALTRKRPATAMSTSSPYSLAVNGGTRNGKVTPNSLSTLSSSSDHGKKTISPLPVSAAVFKVKGAKPVIKGTSNPAMVVVSSSHATPTLSSTASLARPPASVSATQRPRPLKVPTTLLSGVVEQASAVSSQPPSSTPVFTSALDTARPISPSKPVDLAFGQARLRDLIKKYQGQVQKT